MAGEQRVLDPPAGALVRIDRALVCATAAAARGNARRRVIQPFHRGEGEPLHRMLNAIQPGSYVRPHRHLDPPKAEAWVMLAGAAAFFVFEDDGRIRDCVRAAPGGEVIGIDLQPGLYHSFAALEPDTVVYEVKTGPYRAATDKSFAPWAPAADTPEAAAYLASLLAKLRVRTPAG
jgi:cupin fold WbuC family metalloprotein